MFKLAESLPQVQVGLYGYKFGPKKNDVCYIVEHKDKQIEEIDAETALIIDQQRKIDGVGSWPYFSSKLNCNVTFQGDIKFFKGKAVSEQLAQLVSQYNAKRSVVAYNTLDVLGYYHSKEIKNICDDKLYKQLQKVLPYRYK